MAALPYEDLADARAQLRVAATGRAAGGSDTPAERPLLAAVDPALDEPPEPETSCRILVVDDDGAMRALCRVNLEIEGFAVLEARDGIDALVTAEREQPDLVLLDVMMPGLDGFEVAERLTAGEHTHRIPIILMTALAAREDRRRGFDSGAVGYVLKPFDPLVLGGRVRETLARVAEGERDALRREILDPE